MKFLRSSLVTITLSALAVTLPAHATNWTAWTYPATPTGATGILGSSTVTYTGQIDGVNYIDGGYGWTPSTSYIGGPVTSAPPNTPAVLLNGGTSQPESITFSSAITNPVIAIFSLGAAGNTASFDFTDPFTIVAGGPSIHYGGGSITSSGDIVYGTEGNGVIEFLGSYTTIDFTTPVNEGYYAFTVGTAATPEPGTLSLLGLGLGVLPVIRRKLTRRA